MKERYQLLHDSKEIKQHIVRMASEITTQYDGEHPLFVALLRGGAPFASRLMTEIARQAPDFHPELDYMMTSRYPSGTNPAGETQIVMDILPTTEVKNRTVIILDDVLDMGETAKTVRDHMLDLGARYVALAVLVEKDIAVRTANVEADYVGFRGETGWLVGYGMNDSAIAPEAYRWADGIWRIAPERPDMPPQLARV